MFTSKKKEKTKGERKYIENWEADYPYIVMKKAFLKDQFFLNEVLEKMQNAAVNKEVEEEYEIYYGA